MYLAPFAEGYFYEEQELKVEPIPKWSELLDEEEFEEIAIEIADTLFPPLNNESDSIIINFNRWNPDYASHNNSTIPDSLKLVGTEIAFKKLHGFFENLESITDEDTCPIEVFHWGDSQIEGDGLGTDSGISSTLADSFGRFA